MESEFLTCCVEYHKLFGSKYDKDKVPYNLFINKKTGKLCKMCIDCRIYWRDNRSKNFNSKKELYQQRVTNKCEYLPCLSTSHNSKIHPKNKVPYNLFIQENSDQLYVIFWKRLEEKKVYL